MYETDQNIKRRKTILVGVCLGGDDGFEVSMEELSGLAEAEGLEVVADVTQNLASQDAACYIGSGKVQELKGLVFELDADLVVVNNQLSPSQLANLAHDLEVEVIDRTNLILNIFADRARTKEAKLQVDYAKLQYMLPRLVGLRQNLSRQGGTGGSMSNKGAGETQIELDRRRIEKDMSELRKQLREITKNRDTQRRKRQASGIPQVALVGYTNAGKSTLLNALTGAGIPANNRLFDTLDTTTRLLTVSDTLDVVISDTVGFIRKLPHQLVEAFKATLEELEYADLLLHVIDISDPHWLEQAQIVDELIEELGAQQIPCLRVYNKSDLYFGDIRPHGEDSVNISAKTGEGVDELLARIDKLLDKGTRRVMIHLPYDKGGLLDMLYREAKVESVEYGETIDVAAVCVPRVIGQVKDYIEGYREPKEDWEE